MHGRFVGMGFFVGVEGCGFVGAMVLGGHENADQPGRQAEWGWSIGWVQVTPDSPDPVRPAVGTLLASNTSPRGSAIVQRMRGCDDGFLFIENATQVYTYTLVAELVPTVERTEPLTVPALRRHVEARLPVLPSFRRRMERVPWGLHHPVFVNDPDFDLDYHLRHVTLPTPGEAPELDAYMSEVVKQTLDRRHPFWQLVLVDGLAPGTSAHDGSTPTFRQALVLRVHHVIADGTASRTTIMRLLSDVGTTPVDAADLPIDAEWNAEHPRRSRLVVDALRDQARSLRRMPPLVRATARNASVLRDHRRDAAVEVPKMIVDTPECSLNDAFSIERSYLRTQFAIDQLKVIKNAAGVTINDAVLGVVAGALKGYLEARDDLPEKPLTVNVPTSTNPPGRENRQHGNWFANFFSTLATDIDDPWERLQRISTVAREARAQLDIQDPELVPAWLEYTLPLLAEPVSRRWASFKWQRPDRSEFSVIVSNVRGPDGPMTFDSLRTDRLHLQGPAADGAGLNLTMVSYDDTLNIVVTTNPDAVDDPHEIIERLQKSLAELVELASRSTSALRS